MVVVIPSRLPGLSGSAKGGGMRSKRRLLFLTTFILLIGTGCGRQQLPDETETIVSQRGASVGETPALLDGATVKQQITVLAQDSAGTLDPYLMVGTGLEKSIAAHIWDTLVWRSDDFDLEPGLAESWRLMNDLTWEIALRHDINFHNGEPFNAQSVKFSLERTVQLEDSVETFASDVALQSVEVIDDYTVRIHTAEPAVSMIYELSTVEMLPPAYYAKTALEELSFSPIGSGPYQVASWDPDGRVVLEANTDYWRGAPAIETLVFQAESDVNQRLTRLAEASADIVIDLAPDNAEAANTEGTKLVTVESTRRLFVGLRAEEDTPLADRRVRQAMNYALDVQALIAEFHAGYGQRYGSWVNPPYANPELGPWPYDPDKAKDLLTQAGYSEGFEVAMDTPVGRYYRDQEIAEAIAAQLERVGIRVTVQPQEWSTYASERLIPKKTAPLFLLSLMSRGDGLEDARNLAFDFPFNPTLWYNDEFEQLIGKAGNTFNQTLHLSLLRQAQAVAYEEAPWIWLWRPFHFYGVSQDLNWWQPRADGLIYLYIPAPKATTD
jgi:peptide/nickel transport system substrate-binding protein